MPQNKEHVKRSHDDGAGKDPGGVTEAPLKLPRSVVKRIVMLDQEQSRISGAMCRSCSIDTVQ